MNLNTRLFSTLLGKAPQAITFEKVYLYGEDIIGVSGKENKERNYNQLARVLSHRLDLAKPSCVMTFGASSNNVRSRPLSQPEACS